MAASAAQVYEDFFVPALFGQWPDRFLEIAGIPSGADVVDVGCGTGVLTRRLRERFEPDARIVGVDPNEGMLAVARRADGIEWVHGFAEDLPFGDQSFDAAVSQFALMFFDDRRRALEEVRRVTRPGGRVAIAVWATLEQTPGYAAMVDLLNRLFGVAAANALRAPYNLGDAHELEGLLSASFSGVEVTQVDGTARFASVADWVHTDIRGWTLSDMSDDDYRRLLDAAQREFGRFIDDTGRVRFEAPALIAVGDVR